MAGPDDQGGFQLSLPPGDQAIHDMRLLVAAILSGDEERQDAILAASADLERLALTLATTLAACLSASVRHGKIDPDAPAPMLTDEELFDALAILVVGITGPDDDLGPGT